MGSVLHFFDLNQSNSSRKLVAHRGQTDGNDAPRNSLEFVETSHNYNVIQDDIPYSCQVKQQPSKMNYRSNDTPIKKLIDEEMSKRTNTKRSTPSVVARLMGMDDLPSQTYPLIHADERKEEKPRSNLSRKEATKLISGNYANSLSSASFRKTKQESEPIRQPQLRKHPQEELLQKFKKDFEAWQTPNVWDHSRKLEEDDCFRREKVNQIFAQENLNKERMARYWESRRFAKYKKPSEQPIILQRESYLNKQSPMVKFNEKHDRSSSPTRIVILRPNLEGCDNAERSWPGSPEISETETNMQNFLEEVKERLKSEILGKAKNNTTTRDFIAETSFGESSGEDTKRFARHIAKRIRDSVTRDLGTSLIRSETRRSHRNEFRVNGPQFPEFVNRDTRKLLSERLKNVIRNETNVEIPLVPGGRSRTIIPGVKSRSMHDFSKFEDKKPLIESIVNAERNSPRNLERSLSAPVSGTAFAKLMLEAPHVLTGAHIHRKQEAPENSSPESRRKKKDGFNLKGTVSTFKQNFTLKGKLFGKKTHFMDESAPTEFDSSNSIVTSPSIVPKMCSVQDNSTEVPPSPASVSSSSLDEFCRPGVPSPVSPLQAPFIDGQSAAKVSTESSSIFAEPRNLSQHVEHGGFKEVEIDEKSCKDESVDVQVEGHAQAYIREILITSGLYDGEVFDESFPKWDLSKKPIPKWVFDQVEEAYRRNYKLDKGDALFSIGDINISRKMLFDLTNVALPMVMKPTINSTFKNWVMSPFKIPNTKRQLDDLWRQVQAYVNPDLSESNSVDGILVSDVRKDSWCSILHEDHYVTGKKMESAILEDLIDELIFEMLSSGYIK